MCVDRTAASKLIGPKGATIARLRETTSTVIKLSKPEVVFPGTDKQVLLVGGEVSTVVEAIDQILENVMPDGEPPQKQRVELVIPNSSAPAMIGKGGNIIQRMRADHGVALKVYDNNSYCDERVMAIDGPLAGVANCLRDICTILSEDGNLKSFTHVDYRPQPETYYVQTMPSYGVKGKGGKGAEYVDQSGYPVALPVPVVHPRAGKQGALAGMPPQVTDHQLAVCFNIAMADIAKIGNVQKFGADLGTVVMLGDVGVDPDERSITVTGTLRACQATHARIVEAIPTGT
jgi:hypothetical protein